MVPRRPFLIMSPVRCTEVGSPTMHQSSCSPRAFSALQTTTVPSRAGPSSSLVSRKAMLMLGSGQDAANSSQATTMAASEAFMSLLPRPYNMPLRWVGVNGSCVHWSKGPVGTTSVCPANTKVFALAWVLRFTAHRLLTRKLSGPLSMRSQANPSGVRREAIRSRQPASSGVTEGREMSCSVSWRVRDIKRLATISRATNR